MAQNTLKKHGADAVNLKIHLKLYLSLYNDIQNNLLGKFTL